MIEDAAHAFPTLYNGKPVGSLSEATCFSFYATKTITTGEGGMITTDSDAYADRCRLMSLHGISRNAWNRYTSTGSWYYEILDTGYKYNLTDVAAALGLVQLRKADCMRDRREAIAQQYTEAFASHPGFEVPAEDTRHQHAWHLYILRVRSDVLGIDRATFIQQLRECNIGTSVHFIPLHTHPYYRETYGYSPNDFPHAVQEYERAISLPIYSRMTDSDVASVIEAVLKIASAPAARV